MYALNYQLDYIIEKEGLNNRYQRHLELAQFTRAWAKKHFDLLVEEGLSIKHCDNGDQLSSI